MNDDEELRHEVRRLRDDVDALHGRLAALEDAVEDGTGADDAVDAGTADAAGTADGARDDGATDAAGDETAVRESTAAAGDESSTDPGPTTTGSRITDRDWELAVGVRWLGLAGALALVVGVVLFVRLAIERGYLGPLGRVAAGTILGGILFGGGRYAADRQGSVRWGRIAAGTGLAIAYFSIYAAYGFEAYREAIGTPLWAVLVALTLLVAATAAISIRDGAPLVVGEAFLLGYVTAALSTEAATLVVTPTYALLLAGGLVAIATVRPWSGLLVSSVFASYGVLGLWIALLEPPAAAIGTVAVLAFLTYLLGSYVLRGSASVVGRRFRAQLVVLTAVNAVSAAALLETALRDAFPGIAVEGIGTIAIALGLAGTYAVTDRRPVRREHAAAAGSVVFLAAGLGMALEPFWTTVATLVVVCGAVALARTVDAPAFRIGAHGVAAALVVKLLAVDATALPAFEAADPVATLTGRPVSFGLAICVFYGLAWWFSVDDTVLTDYERSDGPSVDALYAAAATGLAVIAFALELSGLGVSVAWVLYGFALLGIGVGIDRLGVRVLGVAVLGLATAKVFLFDTSELDTVARTASFLVLGSALLAASYLYARSEGILEEGLERGDASDE